MIRARLELFWESGCFGELKLQSEKWTTFKDEGQDKDEFGDVGAVHIQDHLPQAVLLVS